MHALLGASLHHLVIALLVAGDEDDFGSKALPRVSQQLHGVRSSAALLAVPENHALGFNVPVDEPRHGRAKGAFLVRPNPNQEPVGRLDAGGEGSPNAGACADTDSALKHG